MGIEITSMETGGDPAWQPETGLSDIDNRTVLSVLDVSDVGVFVLDSEFRIRWINGTIVEYFGLAREDVIGEYKPDVLADEIKDIFERPERFATTILETYRNNTYAEEFTCHVLPGGDRQERWLLHQSHPIKDGPLAGGRIEHYTDVTQGAQELERKNRAIDEAPIGITLTDPGQADNPIIYANERFCEMTGYDSEEVIGRNHRMLQGPETRPESIEQLRTAVDNWESTTVELRNYRADGSMFWNRVSIAPITDEDGRVTNWVGFLEDITEDKKRERELGRNREFLARSQRVAGIGNWVLDLESGEGHWSDEVLRIYGLDGDEQLDPEEAIEYYHPEDRDRIRDAFERLIADGTSYDLELRLLQDGGGLVWVRTQGEPRYEDGELVEVYGTTQDITDRKQRERELERQNDLFAKAQDLAEVGAWECDPQEGEVYFSEQIYDIYGVGSDHEPAPEQDIQQFYHPEDRDTVREAVEGALRSGEAYDIEVRLIAADGTEKWVRTRADPIVEDGEVLRVRGTIQDITDRKRRERELERKNSRLDEFASVVSHDLRNPLQVARGRLEGALDEYDSEHLDAVEQAHERMETLIDDLLALARSGESVDETEIVDLSEIVRQCWHNVSTDEAELVADAEMMVRADRTLLRQLVENLFRNAVEHGGDTVTVWVGKRTDPDGFYVADDGRGVDESKRDLIFEPGYSRSKKGTGYGLSIVSEVAKAHGWDIEVTDSRDGGARFDIVGVDSQW